MPPTSRFAFNFYNNNNNNQTQNNLQSVEISQTDSLEALMLIASVQQELVAKLAAGSDAKATVTKALLKAEESAKVGGKKSDVEAALERAAGAFTIAGKTCDAVVQYGQNATVAATCLGGLALKFAQAMGWN